MKNANPVIGALIGDIAGSVYEFDNRKSKDIKLFAPWHGRTCRPTDDSIMTLAVCEALRKSQPQNYKDLAEETVRCMQNIGRAYPNCGYGGRFLNWIFSDDPKPYQSYGNGAAMRVSGAACAAQSLEEAEKLAETVTAVTHDHPEGIQGGKTAAGVIRLARSGAGKEEIRAYAEKYYALDFTIDAIRPSFAFDVSCRGTVPQAIEAFLEADGFEDAVCTALSLGGDSDTLACITGAVAGAYYGVPDELITKAFAFLDARLRKIYEDFAETFG